jgi:hypothetical protein
MFTDLPQKDSTISKIRVISHCLVFKKNVEKLWILEKVYLVLKIMFCTEKIWKVKPVVPSPKDVIPFNKSLPEWQFWGNWRHTTEVYLIYYIVLSFCGKSVNIWYLQHLHFFLNTRQWEITLILEMYLTCGG